MNPYRVDYLIDLAYGVMIFVAIVLIVVVETRVGVAFGAGVLVSYAIHVTWKMARFDPEWMTTEVAASVEETLIQEVDDLNAQLEELNKRIDRRPRANEIETQADGLADESGDPKRENRE